MPVKKGIDVVLLAHHDFHLMEPIGSILESCGAFLVDNRPTITYAAKGQVEEMGHQYGPLLKLHKTNGSTVSIRIPWHQIVGIVSGDEAELEALGFRPCKRAVPLPKS